MQIKGDYKTLEYRIEHPTNKTVIESLIEDIKISTRLIRKLKSAKSVCVNGNVISLNAKTRVGDVITVKMLEAQHGIVPNNIPIDVIYEDEDLIVLNKSTHIVAHPTAGHASHTLSNAVRHYALSKGEDYKPRLINRLDRDTSGIILFAKNPYAQHIVSEEMKSGHVEKYYMALVHGRVQRESGTIDLPIGLSEDSIIVRTVRDDGKHAITHYNVVERYDNSTLLKVKIDTGRTHQIRVHMRHLNHPIVGDTLYGSFENVAIKRQALHACEMIFKTPRCGVVNIKAPLPEDIKSAIQILA